MSQDSDFDPAMDVEKQTQPEICNGVLIDQGENGSSGNSSTKDDGILRLGLEALEPNFSSIDLLRSTKSGLDLDSISPKFAAIDGDPKYSSPFAWSVSRKIFILITPFFAAFCSAYSAGAYTLAANQLLDKWQVTTTEFNVGVTLFVTGFGVAPMVLAPVSEAYGRYWVFVGSGIVFFLGIMGCAVTDSYGGILISRLINGLGASVFATLTGGVVADVFHKEDRNTPMALYSLVIVLGTGSGPLVSGIIVDRLIWRWIFYHQLITVGATTVAIFLLFQETRSNVVLAKKCRALTKALAAHKTSQGPAAMTVIQFQPQVAERKLSMGVIYRSFAFPMKLLISEPVVFCFSLWASFAWAILYMQFNSIGMVFKDVYGFNSTQIGAVYTAVAGAAIVATGIAIAQDYILRRLWPERMGTPEGRLLAPGFQSILLPVGLFWFGWTSRRDVHWISPTLAIGSCTLGIFSIYLAVFNYLADTYGRFSSSAQAAQSMCRNLLAGIFPLFTHIMLRNMGYSGALSMLGGIGLALTAIPWLLAFYGQKIRARSQISKAVMETELQ